MDELRRPDDEDASVAEAHRPRTIRERWEEFISNRSAEWRELRYAKQAGQHALACYWQLRTDRPELSGRTLYEAFVCDYSAVEIAAARTILHRAEASFASWPNERDLIFRDVVQYVVILDYLAFFPKRKGTTANMTSALSKIIPSQL